MKKGTKHEKKHRASPDARNTAQARKGNQGSTRGKAKAETRSPAVQPRRAGQQDKPQPIVEPKAAGTGAAPASHDRAAAGAAGVAPVVSSGKHVDALPIGAYFDREARAALVFNATPARVDAVLIVDGIVDVQTFRPSKFTHRFTGRWPAYPLRRGARILLNSELAKSDAAARRLRLMLTQ